MALLGLLSLNACDNDELTADLLPHGAEQAEEAEQVISLKVFNGGDGLTTRAGRPLYGAEAKHTIDKVKLWICNADGQVLYVKEFNNWQSDENVQDYDNGRQTELKLSGDDRLKDGTYTVYAVGYNTDSDYDLSAIESVQKSTADNPVTYSPNMILMKKSGSELTAGEEIFAGSLNLVVADGKGFEEAVVLNRQVAGAFIYVKDIPYMSGTSRYLRLVASDQNRNLVLGNFANTDWQSNGGAASAATYVVNGTNPTGSEYEICKIDLTKWFKALVDNNGDGLIDATIDDTPDDNIYPQQGNNWNNPYKTENPESYPTFRRGAVFGGEFIIPFVKTGKQTLVLQLTDDKGTELLSWNINLPATDQQITKGKNVTFWGQSGADWSWLEYSQTEDKNSYSIVRNHLYGVGNRTMDNPGFTPDPDLPNKPVDPVDPEDPSDKNPEKPDPTDPNNPNPDPDIDEPESLNNKQVLILQVNDNWEIIHDMDLD